MAALINALDNYTPMKQGDNGHSEFTWSNKLEELIPQIKKIYRSQT